MIGKTSKILFAVIGAVFLLIFVAALAATQEMGGTVSMPLLVLLGGAALFVAGAAPRPARKEKGAALHQSRPLR